MPTTESRVTLLVAHANHQLLPGRQDFIRRHERLVMIADARWANNDVLYESTEGVRWGTYRFTLHEFAREIARVSLAKQGIVIADRLPLEATLTQLVHEARPSLTYFREVAGTPHFCAALYNTLNELRCEGITPPDLAAAQRGGKDLARLLTKYQAALQRHGLADEHHIFSEATRTLNHSGHPLASLPILLNHIEWRHQDEKNFLASLIKQSPEVLALAPVAMKLPRPGRWLANRHTDFIDEPQARTCAFEHA